MELKDFFAEHPKAALGFSGGVDSSYLLYAAGKLGADVRAYFVKSQFQPEFELLDAKRLTDQLGIELHVIACDILTEKEVRENPQDRCYFCKNRIFGLLTEAAQRDGYDTIIDGTNASDQVDDRPGMRALAEMKVLSPLRMCGLTKGQVRARSKEAGLFTWDKPAYACLATRISTGEQITAENLQRVEHAEGELAAMGFRDFRIRVFGSSARLQLKGDQMDEAIARRSQIRARIKPYFDVILLDLEER